MTTSDTRVRLCTLLVLLCGCGTVNAADGARSSVMLSIHLLDGGASAPIADGIILNIDGNAPTSGEQFAFPVDPASAAGRSEFLVCLQLLPGSYRLSRLSGVMRSAGDDLRFDVEMNMLFEVPARTTQYLGRLELSRPAAANSADSRVRIVDAYREDRPRLIRGWPAIRSRVLQKRLASSVSLINRAPPPAPASPASGQYVPPVRLDRTAESLIPAKARPAFRAFLKSKPPRAFAFAGSGAFGAAAGGENVVARALKTCRQTARADQDCRLFALDDTLVTAIDWSSKTQPPPAPQR